MIARIVFGLLGFLISLYFTLVYYGKMRAEQPFLPRVCTLGSSSCQELIRRPEARLLGLPNFVLGLFFYAAVVAEAVLPRGSAPSLEAALLVAAGGAVVLGLVLSYVLIVRLRTNCILCFASHAINLLLFVLLVAGGGE